MLYDAVVIGAGPAGITAALYLVRSGVSVALVENAAPGGQILSTAEIENYPGFPKSIKGWELADLFDAHLAGYPVERVRGQVLTVEQAEGRIFRLTLAEGNVLVPEGFDSIGMVYDGYVTVEQDDLVPLAQAQNVLRAAAHL